MANTTPFVYKLIQETFSFNGERFNVTLTPQMFAECDGLGCTGNYTGILIGEELGSVPFQLSYVEDGKWDLEFLYTREQLQPAEVLEMTTQVEIPNGNSLAPDKNSETAAEGANDVMVAVREDGRIEQVTMQPLTLRLNGIEKELNGIIEKRINGKR